MFQIHSPAPHNMLRPSANTNCSNSARAKPERFECGRCPRRNLGRQATAFCQGGGVGGGGFGFVRGCGLQLATRLCTLFFLQGSTELSLLQACAQLRRAAATSIDCNAKSCYRLSRIALPPLTGAYSLASTWAAAAARPPQGGRGGAVHNRHIVEKLELGGG